MSRYNSKRYNENLLECYIYLYHTDECFIIPQYPDTIQDHLDSSFGSQNALSRTAPVFSYNNSGPRTVQISITLHRDLMHELNLGNVLIHFNGDIITDPNTINTSDGDDYVDILIKKLQAVALPRYKASSSEVEPPMVAVQLSNDIFIKGVVNGGVSVTYDYPVLENNKYAKVIISFNVSEVRPYDADSVGRLGSFRGLTTGLYGKMFPEIIRKNDIVPIQKNYREIKMDKLWIF